MMMMVVLPQGPWCRTELAGGSVLSPLPLSLHVLENIPPVSSIFYSQKSQKGA